MNLQCLMVIRYFKKTYLILTLIGYPVALHNLCPAFATFNPFVTDKKKVKSVATLGNNTRQQAVKLGLSV